MDQWLKTGKVKKLNLVVESNHLPSTFQDTDRDLVKITENAQPSILQKGKKRSNDDEYYVKYGFSFTGDVDFPKPCVVKCCGIAV